MFSTEPRAAVSFSTWELGRKTRHAHGNSKKPLKTDYNRAFRRAVKKRVAAEVADYLNNGTY